MKKTIDVMPTAELLGILHDNYVWHKDITENRGKDDIKAWFLKGLHMGELKGFCTALELDYDDESVWERKTKKIVFKRGK